MRIVLRHVMEQLRGEIQRCCSRFKRYGWSNPSQGQGLHNKLGKNHQNMMSWKLKEKIKPRLTYQKWYSYKPIKHGIWIKNISRVILAISNIFAKSDWCYWVPFLSHYYPVYFRYDWYISLIHHFSEVSCNNTLKKGSSNAISFLCLSKKGGSSRYISQHSLFFKLSL